MTRRGLLAGLLAAASPARAEEAAMLGFDALYASIGVRGMVFSETTRRLAGHAVRMRGFMAPPLKAESRFFVLSREPLALCPFCQSDADWPVDIVVVYLRRTAPLVGAGAEITVTGRLEAGSWTDPETGFVSQLRLVDARFARA